MITSLPCLVPPSLLPFQQGGAPPVLAAKTQENTFFPSVLTAQGSLCQWVGRLPPASGVDPGAEAGKGWDEESLWLLIG